MPPKNACEGEKDRCVQSTGHVRLLLDVLPYSNDKFHIAGHVSVAHDLAMTIANNSENIKLNTTHLGVKDHRQALATNARKAPKSTVGFPFVNLTKGDEVGGPSIPTQWDQEKCDKWLRVLQVCSLPLLHNAHYINI
jgi:hypothetical protein